ncbi:MAG: FecR domain-containing protein [Myxococcaceae bacterium]
MTAADTQRLRARLEQTLRAKENNARLSLELPPRQGFFASLGPARTLLFGSGFTAVLAATVLSIIFIRSDRYLEELGTFEVVAQSGSLSTRVAGQDVEITAGEATLLDRITGVEVRNEGPTALRRDLSGVRIVRGKARLQVQKRHKGTSPAIIFVSDGSIEVMGTQFTVTQKEYGGGQVTLHEGAIRFRPLRGTPVDLLPGQTLTWPLPEAMAVPAPPPEPAAPTPLAPSSPGRARSADELLQEVEVLRGRGEYETAARKLSEGLRSQPVSTRERLSFELGSILTHQIQDASRACAHWRRHTRQYSGGRYRQDVKRAQSALDCPPR